MNTESNHLTTRGYFEQWLCSYAIFESKAKEIMDAIIPKIEDRLQQLETNNYKITWDRPASEYPTALYNTIIVVADVKGLVFEWAEQNMPMAFWKPMFDPNFKTNT